MEVTDQATATEAALNLDRPGSAPAPKPGEPPAPRVQSTTAKLFPEFVGEDGVIYNQPVKPFEDKDKALPPAAATPAMKPAPAIPPAPAPTTPVYLDLSKLPDGTMVRMKVDGVEMDVPAKDVLKNIQLERHLTIQGQKLAAERANLEAERAALRQPTPPQPSLAVPKPGEPPAPAPAVKPAEDPRIAALETQLAELRTLVAPQQFQEGLKRLDAKVKADLGADDFLTYAPKIQAFVDAELAKPEVAANPMAIRALDTQAFWFGKYQEMKLKDLMAGNGKAAPAPPAPVTPSIVPRLEPISVPAGTVPVIDRNGNAVAIPVIEPSSGAPSRESPDANWQGRYQAAFETAKKTGRTEDWMEVFRLKREGGQA